MRRGAAVLALAVLLSACGSRAEPTTAPAPTPSVQQLLPVGPAPSDPAAGTSAAPAPGEPVSSPAAAPVLPEGVGPLPTYPAKGVVTLGFFLTDDASAVYKALGISGPSFSRAESMRLWNAIVAQVNARGGLAGRTIRTTFAWIDSESGSNASRAQAACEQFTRDQRVFAVVVDGAGDLSLARCLAARGTPTVDVGQTSLPYDDVDLRGLAPYLYLPGRLSMGRFETYVDQLARHGFFSKSAKVGLLRFDLPNHERTRDRVLLPALRRHGMTLTSDVAFSPVEGTRDLPRAADEASAAVLQMRSRGVDHVLFLGSGLSLPYVFPTVAESQGYRPRYGVTTDDGPAFMAENAPAAQLADALAVGWEPQYDVADSDAVLRASAVWRSCVAVVKKAGFTARDGRRCTGVYFLEAALRGSSALSAAALRAGADRLGTTAYSTQTYATRYGPGRYDGVSAVRVLRFDDACTCFRYLTGNLPL